MLKPAALFAQLVPTRRILCLCATAPPSLSSALVGVALSDPYLAGAEELLLRPRSLDALAAAAGPDSLGALAREHDAAAVLFALPMLPAVVSPPAATRANAGTTTTALAAAAAEQWRRELHAALSAQCATAGLLTTVCDERLSADDVRARCADEPEMWESAWEQCAAPSSDASAARGRRGRAAAAAADSPPSLQAAVALNAFLWEHCGGWRNTFG